MKRRKAIMVEAELADMVKDIASRYGMAVSSYVRALLRSAVESERHGIFAPRGLTRYTVLRLMSRMGVAPLPLTLLSVQHDGDAVAVGSRIGSALRGLDVDVIEALAVIVEGVPGAIVERDKFIIVFTGEPWSPKLKGFLKGFTEALGFTVEERGPTLIIQL